MYNVFDYIIFAIFFLSMIAGLMRGLVREVVSLITWIAAFVIATLFCHPLAAALSSSPNVQSMVASTSTATGMDTTQPISWLTLGLSFAGLFILTIIMGAIVNFIISRAIEGVGLGLPNRFLGGIFGFFRGFLINLLIIFLLQLIPDVTSQNWWNNSVMVKIFNPSVTWLANYIQPGLNALKQKVGPVMNTINTGIDQQVTNFYQGNSTSTKP